MLFSVLYLVIIFKENIYISIIFSPLRLLENLELQSIKVCETIRRDGADISSDFAKKNRMQRGDCKSIITSNSIVFIWIDSKHVFLALT